MTVVVVDHGEFFIVIFDAPCEWLGDVVFRRTSNNHRKILHMVNEICAVIHTVFSYLTLHYIGYFLTEKQNRPKQLIHFQYLQLSCFFLLINFVSGDESSLNDTKIIPLLLLLDNNTKTI